MDEDREKGRIVSLKVRRERMTNHARSMVPLLAQARADLTAGMKQHISLRAYADWLNRHDYKTAQGKVWRAQTVARLFDVDESIKAQAKVERDGALAVLRYKHRLLTPHDRKERHADHLKAVEAIGANHAAILADALALKAALTG